MNRIDSALLSQKSPLELAYIGDCVYELLARTEGLSAQSTTNTALHKRTKRRVNAHAQASCAQRLLPLLTEEEAAVFRRGRNAKVKNVPKGTSQAEYAFATALECLFGWLYLAGRDARLAELYEKCEKGEESE